MEKQESLLSNYAAETASVPNVKHLANAPSLIDSSDMAVQVPGCMCRRLGVDEVDHWTYIPHEPVPYFNQVRGGFQKVLSL